MSKKKEFTIYYKIFERDYISRISADSSDKAREKFMLAILKRISISKIKEENTKDFLFDVLDANEQNKSSS
jgi:hypothetical protein